jgi:2-methylcitrate dehydratase PrpD
VERVDIKASPAAMALCNRRNPKDEFAAQVSLHHWAAAALMRGATGIEVLSDAFVHDPAIIAFQDRITATEDPSRRADAAEMKVRLNDGRTLVGRVDHGIGSASNPMTDAQLEAKFTALSDAVVGAERSRKLIAQCRNLENLADAGAIARDAM